MQQTISENFIYNLLDTLVVSCFFYTSKVKFLLNMKNSQVTKAFNSQVGTSEAIRMLNINTKLKKRGLNPHFSEWLAGLIDGDGSFLLTKKGYASLEITMDIRDEHALQIVKNVYGGSIKLRSNANALRYRLHHKSGLLNLINDVNGLIRNSNRLVQLNKICNKYELKLIYPEKLNYNNGWLAGFFDACGEIKLNPTAIGLSHSGERLVNNNNPQICISVINKNYELIILYKEFFGGTISIISNERYEWSIVLQDQILNFIEYIKKYPLRSSRHKKLHLVPNFYKLVNIKAHLSSENSILKKVWLNFNDKFKRYIHTKSSNLQYLDKTQSL